MQTRIDIIRADGDAPGQSQTRSYGDAENPLAITVLNGTARKFQAHDTDGAFSLKWIPRGAARYDVDRLHHFLSGERILLLQAGQPYEIGFLDRTGTESFCLFFSEPLLREVLADASLHCDLLSAAPPARDRNSVQSADMVFQSPEDLSSSLRALRRNIGPAEMTAEWIEESLLSMLIRTVAIGNDHRRLARRIPARWPATRRRLLCQLQRAREMIEDCDARPPDLTELAQASSLSKFHLLRLFAETFGATPQEYAKRCRVERAKSLLRHSKLSIALVAEKLGYESQSAFAKLFQRHVGMTPRAFRAGYSAGTIRDRI